jgi:phospholipid N-methyltransferase
MRDISVIQRDLNFVQGVLRRLIEEQAAVTGNAFIPWAEQIPNELLQNCKILGDRKYLLSELPKGGTVAEVGTQSGRFAREIIDVMKPAQLHLIDLNWSHFEEKYLVDVDSHVERHKGDSSTLLSTFPDKHFDLVYIDGDHSYTGVWRDIEAAKSKIKPGAHMIFNDYTAWSPAEVEHYGVFRAVNEFCVRDRWPVVYFALHGMGYHDIGLCRPFE